MKISSTCPAALASAQSAEDASGSRTSCTQRGTTTGARPAAARLVRRRGGWASSGCGRLAHRPPCARVCAVPDAAATILFVGDVVGGLGRRTLLDCLPELRERHAPTFVVVNGENVAGGLGITPKIADELFAAGVDVITLGNHTYHRREIYPYLDAASRGSCGPANYLRAQPGPRHGGRRARRRAPRRRQPQRQPLPARRAPGVHRDRAVARRSSGKVDHVLVDMHAEATSEKVAMGWYLDGRVTAVRRHPHARADRRRARAAAAAPPTSPTSA